MKSRRENPPPSPTNLLSTRFISSHKCLVHCIHDAACTALGNPTFSPDFAYRACLMQDLQQGTRLSRRLLMDDGRFLLPIYVDALTDGEMIGLDPCLLRCIFSFGDVLERGRASGTRVSLIPAFVGTLLRDDAPAGLLVGFADSLLKTTSYPITCLQ